MAEHATPGPLALLAAGLLVGGGLALAGWFVGQGFVEARQGDRLVAVKGLAEREVRADTALWPIRFVATGDELAPLRAEIARAETSVRDFLAGHGITEESVQVLALEVNDLRAEPYRSGPIESRFIVAETLMVRSTEVAAVAEAASSLADLLADGVVIASNFGPAGSQPSYLFTGLNDLKPAMIAEATANARAAAQQFADDSDSRLGPIRTASQGVFQILPRDQAAGINPDSQIDKLVRVVSTLNYALED